MPVYEINYSAFVPGGSQSGRRESSNTLLSAHGPIMQVLVGQTAKLTVEAIRTGVYAPAPVEVLALIDTGSSVTCVDKRIIAELNIPPVDDVRLAHAHGIHWTTAHSVELSFPGSPLPPLTIVKAVAVMLEEEEIGVLIGRDILSRLRMTYNGPAGRIELAF